MTLRPDGSSPTADTVPPLSVVMPVHNAMPYLGAAIQAILDQTFAHFEFIIGDDGSTDGSGECAEAFARHDSRIRVIRGSVRRGPAGSSNWVAAQASAPLVARMDADDLCDPRRLELQMRALANHPSAVLVGSLYSLIDAADRPIRGVDRSMLLGRPTPPIAHSSVMYRRWAFEQVGGYCLASDYFEDAELYCRLARVGDILVISDDLLLYRFAGTSARLTDERAVVERALGSMPAMLGLRQHVASDGCKLEPEIFRAIGSLRLWAKVPLRLLGDMARRMRLRPFRSSMRVIAWAVLCSGWPSLARQVARSRLAWRNWRARRRVPSGHLFRWVPHAPSINLGRIDPLTRE